MTETPSLVKGPGFAHHCGARTGPASGTRLAGPFDMLPPFSRWVLLALSTSLAACSAESGDAGDDEEVDSALSGAAAEGTIVQTKANLRIRRTPTSENESNIISVLPKGSDVRIRTATPTRGFYFIEIVDELLALRVKSETGWVYGAYLTGAKTDPNAPTVDPRVANPAAPAAPAEAPPRPAPRQELKVKFTSASCHPLKDDRDAFMMPTLDDYLNTGGYQNEVVLGIDSNEYPYGTQVRFPEIDAKPEFTRMKHGVVFKVVKTAGNAPGPVTTVTLCSTLASILPPAGSELTLKVINPGI